MKRLVFALLALLMIALPARADDSEPTDSTAEAKKRPNFLQRVISSFDRIDERYIEPQHYYFSAMLQGTYSYDFYTLRSAEPANQRVSFAPDGTWKVGPYFGWRWLFGGYSIAVNHSDFSKNKTEIEFSIYTSRVGVDAFYRRTGVDYKLRNAQFGPVVNTSALDGVSFDGVKAGITGINLYYIFNDRRFSYPAAFSQSTCQKISCGSWMAGVSWTKNTLDFDHQELQKLASERLAPQKVELDSGLMFKSVRYHDISLTGGYAYNWVFLPKFLFCSSLQMGLGYKHSTGDASNTVINPSVTNFSFSNFTPNFVGRFSLVFNNTRWYAGMSAIIHSNNYRESRFSSTNTYGSLYMYVGYNFGLKKEYRNKSKQLCGKQQ